MPQPPPSSQEQGRTGLDPAEHARRRQRVLEQLGAGEAMLLFSAPHPLRNGDSEYPYRQDSDLLYLTGWTWPEAALLLRPDAPRPATLFVQPRDPEREVWTGRRPGPEGAVERFGLDAAHPIGELEQHLPDLLEGCTTLHYAAGVRPEHDRIVQRALSALRRRQRRTWKEVPDAFVHPGRILHELRLFKDEAELALLRRAARITCAAHRAAMELAAPGVPEYRLQAEIEAIFRREGGTGPGYGTIVGSGPNACILHYVENDRVLQPGELVLIDAGCELGGYTADVTRTFPVDGRFSPEQRAVYEAVLAARDAVVERVRPGTPFKELQDTAIRVLTEGLVELGVLEGPVDELVEQERHRRYYMHGVSHWLGLDVHDAGRYAVGGKPRALAPGMVLTVEPGLYLPPDDEDLPEAFRGIGIRIEDDVHVTADGPEVLTDAAPRHPDAVEAAASGG